MRPDVHIDYSTILLPRSDWNMENSTPGCLTLQLGLAPISSKWEYNIENQIFFMIMPLQGVKQHTVKTICKSTFSKMNCSKTTSDIYVMLSFTKYHNVQVNFRFLFCNKLWSSFSLRFYIKGSVTFKDAASRASAHLLCIPYKNGKLIYLLRRQLTIYIWF